MSEFNSEWDNKYNKLQEEERMLQTKIKEKQKIEKKEKLECLDLSTQKIFKPTPDYLKMKESELILGKQKKYDEADALQKERIKMEKTLYENIEKKRKEKIKISLSYLSQKQKTEAEAYNQKISTTINEFKIQKDRALINLKQKFENLRNQLIKQHNKEKYQMQKSLLLNAQKETSKESSPATQAADKDK